MILSAQSIRKYCLLHSPGMIYPFVERGVQNGKSYGLSSCSYDMRISHDLRIPAKGTALASTIERLHMPDNVAGFVVDKSSWARVFISAFNTMADPGFRGYMTLELANVGFEDVVYYTGDPVCQMIFQLLDEPTEQPYSGKYQDQSAGPQPARYEK